MSGLGAAAIATGPPQPTKAANITSNPKLKAHASMRFLNFKCSLMFTLTPNWPAEAGRATALRLQIGASTRHCLQPDGWAASSAGVRLVVLVPFLIILLDSADGEPLLQARDLLSSHVLATTYCNQAPVGLSP